MLYKLIIYGEGSLRETLENEIVRLGKQDRILLPGKISNVKEKVSRASVFVMSSDFEGMPNSLMEAMAMGLPCISTDCPCGGPKFLIKDGYSGILVPIKDVEAMKNAIQTVLEDEEKRSMMGERAREITKELAPDKIHKQWEEYIDNICSRR